MISNIDQTIIILVVFTPILVLIMFLPSLLELKRPKDSGPRLIMESMPEFLVYQSITIGLADIEDEQKLESCHISGLGKIIQVLPSLEV